MRHIHNGGNSKGSVINERFLKIMKSPWIQHHTIKSFQIQCFAMNGFIWNSVYINHH